MELIKLILQHPGEVRDAVELLFMTVIFLIGVFKAWQAHDYNKIKALAIPYIKKALAVSFDSYERRAYVRDQVWSLIPAWSRLAFFGNNPENFSLYADQLWKQLKPQLREAGLLDENDMYLGKSLGDLTTELVEAVSSPLADGDPTPIPPRNPLT